ncbi:hypothetical protein PR202_ga08080 [Eleusine coracana subsp. coracana]|uniref:Uncharacterized protein n=1 Tax=Eleusine coracana subsp. coracana TaxID=191504 RepID=A0AAV5BZ48_ELECO|nr:hypothetical protein PR202_ga08080 [Eleusine coracana subsp. coracana]
MRASPPTLSFSKILDARHGYGDRGRRTIGGRAWRRYSRGGRSRWGSRRGWRGGGWWWPRARPAVCRHGGRTVAGGGGGGRQGDTLRRLEACAHVPARVVVAMAASMVRARSRRRDAAEEGWDECSWVRPKSSGGGGRG